MDFLLGGCGCFNCPLSADKGSYNTHDRELHEQLDSQQQAPQAGNKNNLNESNSNISATTTNTSHQQHSSDGRRTEEKPQTATTSNNSNNMSNKQPVLQEFTLQAIADLINENKIAKSSVIVLVGAGMSTAAGVPDFRSPETGIYANLQKYNLTNPEDVFKISYFKNNPAPFYDVSRKLLPSKLYPTLSHYFVRILNEKGFLLRCFSQNVDSLESLSGLAKDKLCLAHGSFETGHCLRCNAEYSLASMRKVVEQGGIPHLYKNSRLQGSHKTRC